MFITEQFGSHYSGFEESPVTKKTEDRRVQRTRQSLRDALIELMIEKGYEEVTVQDIIDRANVGRSTFYAHFLDKQHLFLSGFEQLRVELAQQQRAAAAVPGTPGLSFSRGMFEHVQGYLRVYQALIGKQSGMIVAEHLQQM